MSEGIATEGRRERAVRSCRHHWIIETPHGVTSRGVCKRCGGTRRFPNAADDALGQSGGSTLGRWSRGRGVIGPTDISVRGGPEDGGF